MKKIKNLHFLILQILFVGFLLVSCEKSERLTESNEIGLYVHDENKLSGKTKINDFNVEFTSTMLDNDLHYQVEVKVDSASLKAVVRYDSESIDFEANNVILDYDQKLALVTLGENISEYLLLKNNNFVDNITIGEISIIRLLEYWSSAPKDYKYLNRKVGDPNATGQFKTLDEGIECLRKGYRTTAHYDDRNGRFYTRTVIVGSENCAGRCGAGCGSFLTIRSTWSKDCLDHDMCTKVFGEPINPAAADCGDEFREAADDYAFGPFRNCTG